MKRFISIMYWVSFLLLVIAVGLSFSQPPDYLSMIISWHKEQLKVGGSAYTSWQEGAKKEFSLTLTKMDFKIKDLQYLGQDANDKNVDYVIYELSMNAYCVDSGNVKKTVNITKVVAAKIDVVAKKVIATTVLQSADPVVLDGWGQLKDC